MKFGSLFSGIEGFGLGFQHAKMKCVWQIEIDEHCEKVLEYHFPDVRRYTDVRECGKHNLEPVDLICGGFPCQDLSIAGKREGLAGERSGLWHEFHRIIEELTPEWVVIENVPGLLSSNEGQDFAILLRGLVECGYGVCWRVLDSQYFGVAQRRRRVFIVGHLGTGRAAEVLFERESLSRNPAEGRKAGQGNTETFTIRSGKPGGGKGYLGSEEQAMTLGGQPQYLNTVIEPNTADGCLRLHESGTRPTLNSMQGGQRQPCVIQNNYVLQNTTIGRSEKAGPQGKGWNDEEISFTLDGTQPHAVTIRTANTGANGHGIADDKTHTLDGAQGQAVVQMDGSEKASTLRGFGHGWQGQHNTTNAVLAPTLSTKNEVANSSSVRDEWYEKSARLIGAVRRLTPTECERLQSFPDSWTDVDNMSDTQRYKQLGNAVTVNVIEWIGNRIMEVENAKKV